MFLYTVLYSESLNGLRGGIMFSFSFTRQDKVHWYPNI